MSYRVVFEGLRGITDWHELQAPVDGRCVVDWRAVSGLLCEEHRLVPSDSVGQFPIGESNFCEAGFIQPYNIVSVSREAIAAQPILKAKDVNGARLLPEGSLRVHDARSRRREYQPIDQMSRIAEDLARARRLARRASAEL